MPITARPEMHARICVHPQPLLFCCGIVWTYMHAYGNSHDQSYWSILAFQLPWVLAQNTSTTPIYDTLYREWADSFRATPGDHSGEEELEFAALVNNPQCTTWGTGQAMGLYRNSYNTYNAKAHSTKNSAGQQGGWERVTSLGQHTTGVQLISTELRWEEASDTRMAFPVSAYEESVSEATPVTSLVLPAWLSSA
jgi:hypothetical protein